MPYLDQLSVLPEHMRRGIGTALVKHAINWAGDKPQWLTTYSHLDWNKPFYERLGFMEVAESNCGAEIAMILEQQRQALPEPEKRIAMVKVS